MVRASAATLPRLLVLALAFAVVAGDAEARARRHRHGGKHHHAHISKRHHRGLTALPRGGVPAAPGEGTHPAFLRVMMADRCPGLRGGAEAAASERPQARSAEETRWRALFEKEPETACKAAEVLLYGRGGH